MEEPVELFGLLSKSQEWRYQSQYFPSKLGGYPAWLDPVNLPEESDLKCFKCSSIMTFVLQIYAPDDLYEENDAFHRMIYIFVCQPCGTEWASFRCQLGRKNDYYDFYPIEDGILFTNEWLIKKCCLACGLPSNKISSVDINTNKLNIKLIDEECELRELHPRCNIAVTHQTLNPLFEEWLLNICEGGITYSSGYLDHEKSLYQKYIDNKREKGEELDDSEEKAIEDIQEERHSIDESFKKFCKRTTSADVLYYSRGGTPLWLSDEMCNTMATDFETRVPICENCGSNRTFEFQVLPQLLHYLKNDRIDYGNLCIYTCSQSCKITGKYQRECIVIEKDTSLKPRKVK